MIEIIRTSLFVEQSKATKATPSNRGSCSSSQSSSSSSPSSLSLLPPRRSPFAEASSVGKQYDEVAGDGATSCCSGDRCASLPSSPLIWTNRSHREQIDHECFKFTSIQGGDHQTRISPQRPLSPSALVSTGSEAATTAQTGVDNDRQYEETVCSCPTSTRPNRSSWSSMLHSSESSSTSCLAASRRVMTLRPSSLSRGKAPAVSPRESRSPSARLGSTLQWRTLSFEGCTAAYSALMSVLVVILIQTLVAGSLAQSVGQPSRRPEATGGGGQAASISLRDPREAKPISANLPANLSNVFSSLFKKKPYSKYWTVEQKWDDLFLRGMAVQDTLRRAMLKNFLRDIENYADITISPACERDLKYIQSYARQSTNFRWLAHMFDSTGKSEPGMLTGMLANLGHPVQCIRVRAPGRPSNDSFDERFFEQQTAALGERFRGKYCLASLRPVMPLRPVNEVVSRFSKILNSSLISNISYTGEPAARIKARARQLVVPERDIASVDRDHLRLDQIPFESELYQYLIMQSNFMFSLPRFMGACYPSSCTKDDIRSSLQRTMNDQHQVVDVEFECEQEEHSIWDWFNTPRLIAYVVVALVSGFVFLASLTRYILLSKLQIRRAKLAPGSGMASLLDALDMFSVDKCAGILFVKTKPASPEVDWTKVENNRSTSIDALRGLLMLVLVYSQLTVLGCLPVPFMWSKWSDAMFPFYRSLYTQFFINMSIWSELFYMISAYIIALKVLENHRPKPAFSSSSSSSSSLSTPKLAASSRPNSAFASTNEIINSNGPVVRCQVPNFFTFAAKRYVRLVLPMVAFILFNYIWPRLSNGFVMQDQANKIMRPCDSFGWTNFLLVHNHNQLNETCLWPSHVSATFFQLHLLSYPLLALCLAALCNQFKAHYADFDGNKERRRGVARLLICLVFVSLGALALLGAIYSGLQASQRSLIVPFLIDYIDFDNYRRVIEWTVTPTYNHLTSYMIGLGLAFVVIRARADNELRHMQRTQWGFDGNYNQREGSIGSARSSSTQELNQRYDGTNFRLGMDADGTGHQIHQKQFNISSDSSSEKCSEGDNSSSSASRWSSGGGGLVGAAQTTASLAVCIGSTLSSWFWNGLGQPMSERQTFWFVLSTKLAFGLASAHLFYKYLATRRNSSNPWMVTRFLVPIGRMSLTVFYVSWLVIWFDLLSSLYQWHPSHYFISEKYNEIIFMTLILAMFIYGAFEGIVKRVQYSSRQTRLRQHVRMVKANLDGAANNSSNNNSNNNSGSQRGQRTRSQLKPFESFFDPSDKPTLLELYDLMKLSESDSLAKLDQERSLAKGSNNGVKDGTKNLNSTTVSIQLQQEPGFVHHLNKTPAYLSSTSNLSTISGNAGNLTPSDRYKLNAELRANYSFASIGLYESAGATGDLSHGSTSDPRDKRR